MGNVDDVCRPAVALGGTSVSTITVIITLGSLEAWRHGRELKIEGKKAGGNQLRNMFSWLLANRGRSVHRDDLIAVAGGRKPHRKRPDQLVRGLRDMLKRFEMGDALEERGDWLILQPHPSWRTDTDELVQRYEAALTRANIHDHAGAITTLEAAEALCRGMYLPNFDATPDYSISSEQDYWLCYQKQALHQRIEQCLVMTERRYANIALRSVKHLLRLGDADPEDYDLAAEAAERSGNPRLAAYYRKEARKLRDAP